MPRDEVVVVVLLRERVMVVRASNSGLVADDGYLELGCFSKGVFGLGLGLGLGISTISFMLSMVFLQLALRILGCGWYTSSKALDLHCHDFTHALAIACKV